MHDWATTGNPVQSEPIKTHQKTNNNKNENEINESLIVSLKTRKNLLTHPSLAGKRKTHITLYILFIYKMVQI